MKEGKAKVIKCDFYKENTYTPKGSNSPVTNYAFNIEFSDGIKGLYNAKDKDKPVFVVGGEYEYTAEEKQGKNGVWYIVKKKQDPFAKGGGWKPKPSNVFALELSRKMYNSSFQTEKHWDIPLMLTTADWIQKQIDTGVSRDAMECATTIECANAMNKIVINGTALQGNAKIFDQWLKK